MKSAHCPEEDTQMKSKCMTVYDLCDLFLMVPMGIKSLLVPDLTQLYKLILLNQTPFKKKSRSFWILIF